LAYLDYSSQEFGIAAALSGDPAMQAAYNSGDCYLEFAKLAGAVPEDATKESHPRERALFKRTALGLQYSIGANGLALQLGVTLPEAEDLREHHQRVFPRFWEWSDAALIITNCAANCLRSSGGRFTCQKMHQCEVSEIFPCNRMRQKCFD
jgi:DNA polymerase I-like protein with 3'-5' exonuclease and polymerase domains